MKFQPYIAFLLLLLLLSCGRKQESTGGEVASLDSIRYATGFTVKGYDSYTVAEIIDPWDTAKVLQRYILVDRTEPLPATLPEGTIVRIPVNNIVIYSAVHVAMVDLLGESDKVIGVCESRYMNTTAVQDGIKSGTITDLGESTTPNIEKIIDINTELIIASPFQNTSYGAVEKLGIPIVEGADYMENTPLGRAEWIRFYGLLFDKVGVADSLFRVTEERYLALSTLAANETKRPSILTEKRYGSTCVVPGGDSYMTQLYEDAGADYVFRNSKGTGSLAMSFESVLDQAIHADFWLIKYHDSKDLTYKDLRGEYTPYENFDAFKKKTIYASNSSKVPFYDETAIHPDYLLEDLVKIFHPELLPEHNLRYFHKLGE